MTKKLNKLPLLEELSSDRYNLIDFLQVLKDDDSIDSTKILKIRNMLNPINNTILIQDVENALYLLGSRKGFVDKTINKLKSYGVSDK